MKTALLKELCFAVTDVFHKNNWCWAWSGWNNSFKVPFVGSMYQESSQQLRTWFSEHFSLQNLLRSLALILFLLQRSMSATDMAPKMSKKPRSIRLLRWLDFSQSENKRKTIEKPLKELPWNDNLFVSAKVFLISFKHIFQNKFVWWVMLYHVATLKHAERCLLRLKDD